MNTSKSFPAVSATFFLLFVLSGVWYSCDSVGRSQNHMIKEATAIHLSAMERYDSVYTVLQKEKARVTAKIESTPTEDERTKAYESMIRSIDRSMGLLEGWEESLIGVPGLETSVDEDRQAENEEKIASMSDKEILELQKIYSTRLDELIKEIRGLLTTIQMYEGNA